jgi:hypothetical protein
VWTPNQVKKHELVALVQGTSALEAQGLPADDLYRMVQTAKRLRLDSPSCLLSGASSDVAVPEQTHG